MAFPDDFEPLDALERCDAIFGAYHIGRDDESRAELALLFDIRWLPEAGFLTGRLWSMMRDVGGRLLGLCELASTGHPLNAIRDLLRIHVNDCGRSSQIPTEALVATLIELPKPAVSRVDASLQAYTAYLGFGDISAPSHFRSLLVPNSEAA